MTRFMTNRLAIPHVMLLMAYIRLEKVEKNNDYYSSKQLVLT